MSISLRTFQVIAVSLVCLLVLSPSAFAQGGEHVNDTGPTQIKGAEKPAVAPVVIAVLAVATALVAINDWLTEDTRVDAVTASGGPDTDDILSRHDRDNANTAWESELVADSDNTSMGPNPPNEHSAWAYMVAIAVDKASAWAPEADGRYAWAYSEPDSTPQPSVDNRTAAAAIATFHFMGTEQTNFKLEAQDDDKATYMGVALGADTNDNAMKSSAAVAWSVNAFSLSDDEGMVTVTPPVASVELFHDFIQMEGSTQFRRPLASDNQPDGLAKTLLQGELDTLNTERDAELGSTPLTAGDTVDFTITGVKMLLAEGVFERGTKTDHELVDEYLMSEAVSFVAPDSAQAGFVPNITLQTLIGGSNTAPATSLFAARGEFGTYDAVEQTGTNTKPLAGLLIESEGNLLDAMNLAAQDSTHPLYDIINAKQVAGTEISVTMSVQISERVSATSESDASPGDCVETGIAARGLFVLVGGDAFAQSALSEAEPLATGVAMPNSNPELVHVVPECPTEINERAGEAAVVLGKAVFDCGPGTHGYTVCPTFQDDSASGDWYILAMAFGDNVPLDDPVNSYQYGFVFDADGNEGNNYQPAAQYANDYFQDTDRWYAVEYNPTDGWQLNVTDATGGKAEAMYSGARAIIKDNTILLMVPVSEFSVANPGFRQTAFRHSGDYGQNPPFDWSADFHPGLDEPLATLGDGESEDEPGRCCFGGTMAPPPDPGGLSGTALLAACLVIALMFASRRRLAQDSNALPIGLDK